MKFLKYLLLVVVVVSFSFVGKAQLGEVTLSLDSGRIESQFDYLMKKSSTYEAFKVVKTDRLLKLKANVTDSLNSLKKELGDAATVVTNQKNEITSLNTELKKITDQLAQVKEEKNSMSFLGALVEKGLYNTIMWSLAAILLILAVFAFLLFKRSNAVTASTKQKLLETEEEFETHRKTALRREQKLARELLNAKRDNV
ncbi:tRNA (guanine-N1)-methyltransferase [Marinilabiliaceae bacterium JC017]|nr:tRNA (guanine-N1)-methyltransferase [Marinilabiliaceae bacterium JC017]